MTTLIGMQFVTYLELEPLSVVDQLTLFDLSHNQLEHDVISEQDVRWILTNPLTSFFMFLLRVSLLIHKRVLFSETSVEKFVEFILLAVANATIVDVIDNRNNVRRTFS